MAPSAPPRQLAGHQSDLNVGERNESQRAAVTRAEGRPREVPAFRATGAGLPRGPDFLVIGMMKSGTTTLFRWLGEHPSVSLPRVKEPGVLAERHLDADRLSWYQGLFSEVPAGDHTGEASVTYTDPAKASRAAESAQRLFPEVRLVCVLRHPVQRLRSHYRHQVQRGRERRPLLEAIRDPQNTYVARSCYARCLAPWAAAFPSERLLAVRFEDLFGDSTATWDAVLQHVGLEPSGRPVGRWNESATKPGFRRPLLFAWERGLLNRMGAVPAPVRAVAKRVLLRRGRRYRSLLATSEDPIPGALTAPLWADVERLPALVGEGLSWNR